jgi:hypothetical protein
MTRILLIAALAFVGGIAIGGASRLVLWIQAPREADEVDAVWAAFTLGRWL